jgi:hypothetical protein
MTAESYSPRERRMMRQMGREEYIDTMFDWDQTHLSEYEQNTN